MKEKYMIYTFLTLLTILAVFLCGSIFLFEYIEYKQCGHLRNDACEYYECIKPMSSKMRSIEYNTDLRNNCLLEQLVESKLTEK